jgi:hypothetical protein
MYHCCRRTSGYVHHAAHENLPWAQAHCSSLKADRFPLRSPIEAQWHLTVSLSWKTARCHSGQGVLLQMHPALPPAYCELALLVPSVLWVAWIPAMLAGQVRLQHKYVASNGRSKNATAEGTLTHLQERMLQQVSSGGPFQGIFDGALRHKVFEMHAVVISLEQWLLSFRDNEQHTHGMQICMWWLLLCHLNCCDSCKQQMWHGRRNRRWDRTAYTYAMSYVHKLRSYISHENNPCMKTHLETKCRRKKCSPLFLQMTQSLLAPSSRGFRRMSSACIQA